MKKKLLITGGNGFIGRYFCRECAAQGIDFSVLCRNGGATENADHRYYADLLDARSLGGAMEVLCPDVVVHLAAIASPVHENAAEVYETNVIGTENLLSAAQNCLPVGTRVILASTAGVYGNQEVAYLSEDTPFNPINHYSYSKMVMEFLSRQYADRLDICIIRPFNIIGSGQKENFFIPKLVKLFSQHASEIFLGNLKSVRDYVPVDYCAKVIMDLALSKSPVPSILNICSGVGHSCEEIVHIMEDLTGYIPKIYSTHEFSRQNEIWRLVGDPTRLKSLIAEKYVARPVEDILKEMLFQKKG